MIVLDQESINIINDNTGNEKEISIQNVTYLNYQKLFRYFKQLCPNDTFTQQYILDINLQTNEDTQFRKRIQIMDKQELKHIQILGKDKTNTQIFNDLKLKTSDKILYNSKKVHLFHSNKEYGYNTKSAIETVLSDKNKELENKSKINYRSKNRISMIYKNTIIIDMSVTSSFGQLKQLTSELKKNQRHELEFEMLPGYQISDLEFLLQQTNKIMNNSFNIIPNSVKYQVVEKFKSQIKFLRKPVSLDMTHITETLIEHQYAVTDKADGERYIFYVFENKGYLINTQNKVIYTGHDDYPDSLNGTVLDGEYLYIKSHSKYLFMIFDSLFIGQQDIRSEPSLLVRQQASQVITGEQPQFEQYIDFLTKLKFDLDQDKKRDVSERKKVMIVNKYFSYSDNNILPNSDSHPQTQRSDNNIFTQSHRIYTQSQSDKGMYFLDGLIYHPQYQPYVSSKQSKLPELKWKPESTNSVDLLLRFKEGIYFDNTGEHNQEYKIGYVYLYGEGDKEVPFGIEYFKLPVDSNGHVWDIERNLVQSDTVVEFNNLDGQGINWRALRTRYDKTKGNSVQVGQSVLNTILNPIRLKDIEDLGQMPNNKKLTELKDRIVRSIATSDDNAYYQGLNDKIVQPMRTFHNFVKSQLIYTYFNRYFNQNKQLQVLDLACGRGGDIRKFYYVEVKFYLGVDIDLNGLVSQKNGAIKRYQILKNSKARIPPMEFIQGDMGQILNYNVQAKALGNLDQQFKTAYNKYLSNHSFYDGINCQFAIHFVLKNRSTFNNFMSNIKKFTKQDGVLVFSTLDGDILTQMLSDNNGSFSKEYIDQNGDIRKLLDFIPKYDISNYTKEKQLKQLQQQNNEYFLGQQIDIMQTWINENHIPEYIVFKRFLIQQFQLNGFTLVDTGLFGQVYSDQSEFIVNHSQYESTDKTREFFQDVKKYYDQNDDIGKTSKIITGMSRYYVFTPDTSQTTDEILKINSIKKLLKLSKDKQLKIQQDYKTEHNVMTILFNVVMNRKKDKRTKFNEYYTTIYYPDLNINEQTLTELAQYTDLNIMFVDLDNNKAQSFGSSSVHKRVIILKDQNKYVQVSEL